MSGCFVVLSSLIHHPAHFLFQITTPLPHPWDTGYGIEGLGFGRGRGWAGLPRPQECSELILCVRCPKSVRSRTFLSLSCWAAFRLTLAFERPLGTVSFSSLLSARACARRRSLFPRASRVRSRARRFSRAGWLVTQVHRKRSFPPVYPCVSSLPCASACYWRSSRSPPPPAVIAPWFVLRRRCVLLAAHLACFRPPLAPE